MFLAISLHVKLNSKNMYFLNKHMLLLEVGFLKNAAFILVYAMKKMPQKNK